jgi:predicted SprT family Zn-dependent metalloprotease
MRTTDHTATGHELQAAADAVIDALRAGRVSGVTAVPGLAAARVRLSGRLTRCAGIYRPAGDIAISTHYLAAHGIEAARGVVLHEVAHHVVRTVHGRSARPHGREFRVVAAALGASLRAEAFAAPRTVYLYRCPACGWEWRRGRKAPRGRTYSCGRCAPAYDPRFRLRFGGVHREGAA